MKHLKFIFLSYTFLNICSVFASEDPINPNDGNDSKDSALISEVKMDKENMQNSSEIISSKKNRKSIKKSSDSDEFIPSNMSIHAFLKGVFHSKKVVKNSEIMRLANALYKACKSDIYSYGPEEELYLALTESIFQDIIHEIEPSIPYYVIASDIPLIINDNPVNVSRINPNDPNGPWIHYVKYPSDSPLADLSKKGEKFSRRFKHVIRVTQRLYRIVEKYPMKNTGVPIDLKSLY